MNACLTLQDEKLKNASDNYLTEIEWNSSLEKKY